MRLAKVLSLLVLGLCLMGAYADIPVHCVYDQVIGTWTLLMGTNHHNNTVACSEGKFSANSMLKVKLMEPPHAIDEHGNRGFWTMMYDEGFELVLNGQKYYTNFKYEKSPSGTVTSYCGETSPGWYHKNQTFNPTNWGCFKATKDDRTNTVSTYELPAPLLNAHLPFGNNKELINFVNSKQKLWTAGEYPEYETMTFGDAVNRAGGRLEKPRNWLQTSMSLAKEARKNAKPKAASLAKLPENFDWRNVNGVNYVTPVRNQGRCGSCYAFGTTAMLEARIQIKSKGREAEIISPQRIVSCSQYSQGCSGGFGYLVGKYGEDFGLVSESCFPYGSGTGETVLCSAQKCSNPKRWVTGYHYVGGYYGATDEENMMRDIYENGPVAVSFEVHSDFKAYKSGIYEYTGSDNMPFGDPYRPWESTSHLVLAVGWGVENGTPYWICKNSWGETWGEDGYFRIIRGVDNCAIESLAESAFPVL